MTIFNNCASSNPHRPSLMLATFFLLMLLAPAALAVVHEQRDHIPHGWSHHSKHPSDAILPLRIGLVQPNLDSIDSFLNEVAHPESSSYGKHWTAQQVADKFAPTAETIDAVIGWLVDGGFEKERVRVSGSRIWIELNSTVAEAEKLLNTEYHVYQHEETGKKHVGCTKYHVPEHVRRHVDLITPTVHFTASRMKHAAVARGTRLNPGTKPAPVSKPVPLPKPLTHAVPMGTTTQQFLDLSKCDKHMTPVCLRALYGLNKYTPSQTARNSYGIVEYTPQAYVPTDIDVFASYYATDLVGKRPNLVSIDGGVVQTTQTGFDYNGESNLDLQYGMALVTGAQPVQLYQVGDTLEGASFNDFLDAIDGSYCTADGGDDPNYDAVYPNPYGGGYQGPKACGTVTPANVISTSYGYNEADLTQAYSRRQCNEYAKLGLMGVTMLFSSGDNGVAGNRNFCLNAGGSQSAGGARFNPTFPGGCPYITSVGATQVFAGKTVLNPESACADVIYSGGGFSNYFPRPSFQQPQVANYFAAHNPPYSTTKYNAAGRGFPDLSANGANYIVAVQGVRYLVYGTSASAPVVGAILTLINDARLAAGKGPIGWINPTIYSSAFASAFNDVTNGTNPGCGTNGFSAVKGWDPVTGLGTPNFPKLVNLWRALP
ncbi:subtilisin-like protein [Mycena belliarum]|uniref:tripeptidyl-peptidase II n=1 Tax=Mycena belliarum TaxID=1033014 RepID=A0AAD6UCQ1_9AGAR|nr:subtilisin-like protein [Mycena belliae]